MVKHMLHTKIADLEPENKNGSDTSSIADYALGSVVTPAAATSAYFGSNTLHDLINDYDTLRESKRAYAKQLGFAGVLGIPVIYGLAAGINKLRKQVDNDKKSPVKAALASGVLGTLGLAGMALGARAGKRIMSRYNSKPDALGVGAIGVLPGLAALYGSYKNYKQYKELKNKNNEKTV